MPGRCRSFTSFVIVRVRRAFSRAKAISMAPARTARLGAVLQLAVSGRRASRGRAA